MNSVAIIPARGGSKGIPKKNIMPFCGNPLIAWSILQAAGAKLETYVTSDDEEILAVSERWGATGIKRPLDLATDMATSESALLHALDMIGEVDAVVFLQATSPLRNVKDIKRALEAFEGHDSLFSMCRLDDYCIWKDGPESLNFDWRQRARRQEREPSYLENGSIFIFKPWVLRETGNRLGGKIGMYEMPFWKSFEIDSLEDIPIVEHFFKRNILGGL